MGKYTWSDFSRETDFRDILDFFNELMPRLNDGEEASFCIVFVSRKAYCLFLLLKAERCVSDAGYKVYSDRYVMKNLDDTIFNGNKTVKLVDDTISTGLHFAEIYQMIEQRVDDVMIIPCILMEDEMFQKNKLKLSFYHRENLTIRGKLVKNTNEILRFCTIETLIMHQKNIPYMIEIPNIHENFKIYENDENKNIQYYISVTKEEYEKLKYSNDTWTYYCCKQAGYEQNEVGNDVVIRKNHILIKRFPTFIFNFLIRVQVTKGGDMYHLVLLPFAVLKSVSFSELLQFFFLIFAETPYGKKMNSYIEQHPNSYQKDIYIAVYRAVVFNLSMYIGAEYIEYLNSVLGKARQFKFNSTNYRYNFDKCFLVSNDYIMRLKSHSEYTTMLLGFSGFTGIPLKDNSLLKHANMYNGIKCDYRTVSLLFLALINEMRDESIVESDCLPSCIDWMRFSSIEEYQELLLVIFGDSDQEKLDDIFSMCIVNMLSQSKISNEICFDSDELVVYRGFKYGENSEAYLDLSAKVFFTAVKAFYDILPLNHRFLLYKAKYRIMLLHLKIFLMEYQLYGNVITRDEFKIYSEIFRAKSESALERTINGKQFLLDDSRNPYYIEKLRKYIQNADI